MFLCHFPCLLIMQPEKALILYLPPSRVSRLVLLGSLSYAFVSLAVALDTGQIMFSYFSSYSRLCPRELIVG